MASGWPNYPADVQGGDEPTFSPGKSQNSLLVAQRGTQLTKRLETDASNNLYVFLAGGSLTPSGTQDVRIADATNKFWRILNKLFLDSEESRQDIPLVLASGFIYSGIAASGSATSSAVWNVVRTSFDANGNPSRLQYRANIVWDNRATGWPA